MLQKQLFTTCTFLLASFFLFGQLQSPNDFLPHNLGETYTGHSRLIDYFEHAADNSNLVTLQDYGMTNQNRPLILAFVTSEKNQANLENIRKNNLRLAGLSNSDWRPEEPISIIWISYSVHGNEPSGSECSMQVLYDLIDPNNQKTKAWLENTVVILDPATNPDGYERYTHWFRNAANAIPNPEWMSREHNEPWPGGRENHYQFDLNRDWAWLTQKESRQRIEAYRDWLPHVHPDVHEQYPNNPYYFAPAAEPFHKYITEWQREFQTEIGKNHAEYFDEKGWMYFTREIFDLFYPSYGDTYPTFNGAIGMTYEQAGHSVGGVAVSLKNGDTLTLADRIDHHHTTSLSTIEMTSRNAARLTENFKNYFDRSLNNPQGKYKTFFIKNRPADAEKINRLTALLDLHQIKYSQVNNSTSVSAYDYQTQSNGKVSLNKGDLVISSYQPKSILAQVLFEPEPILSDSLTYDITSWALPYAYGLDAYASTQQFKGTTEYSKPAFAEKTDLPKTPYSLLARWNSVNDAAFLSQLLKEGINVRYSKNAFSNIDQAFDAGTLIIARADNYNHPDWVAFAKKAAAAHRIELSAISSGFSTTGKDIGSDDMQLISAPKIAVLYGEGVSVNSYGFIWHYLEKEAGYPFAAVKPSQLENGNLSKINTLILPEGSYKLSDDFMKKLTDWVSAGGKLIAVGSANGKLAGQEGFSLKKSESSSDGDTPKATPYSQSNRSHISKGTPGAIIKTDVDATHPLAFGLGDSYFSLKTYTSRYKKLDSGWNVGTVSESLKKSGFIGHKYKKELPGMLTFGIQNKGAGKVIYLVDDPLFRGFWYNGKLLFSNALFLN